MWIHATETQSFYSQSSYKFVFPNIAAFYHFDPIFSFKTTSSLNELRSRVLSIKQLLNLKYYSQWC